MEEQREAYNKTMNKRKVLAEVMISLGIALVVSAIIMAGGVALLALSYILMWLTFLK